MKDLKEKTTAKMTKQGNSTYLKLPKWTTELILKRFPKGTTIGCDLIADNNEIHINIKIKDAHEE